MAVGLVVPDVGAAFYASALKSAQDVLEAAGYHVLVLNTGRSPEREREALRTLRAHQVDGLLVATSGGYEEIGVPAVFFDNVPPQRPGAGAVAMDNEAGIRLLVDHLVCVHGHERIAYLGPPESLGTGAVEAAGHGPRAARGVPRRGGARRAAAAARVRAHERAGAARRTSGRAAARELMALDAAPDGDRRRAPTSSPPACCAGCATRDSGCPRTSRSSRSTSRGGRPDRPADDLARPPRRPARPARGRGAAARRCAARRPRWGPGASPPRSASAARAGADGIPRSSGGGPRDTGLTRTSMQPLQRLQSIARRRAEEERSSGRSASG